MGFRLRLLPFHCQHRGLVGHAGWTCTSQLVPVPRVRLFISRVKYEGRSGDGSPPLQSPGPASQPRPRAF